MAGTILFLASKIEEEPLKLRYIVNSCLERFQNAGSQGWHPPKDGSGVSHKLFPTHVCTFVETYC
jgi:hypothetical protein